jgi:IS1 family transposase/lambda repressor-like predicted transcriptional regulator
MNALPPEKRAQIIQLLVEGMSMRAVSRVTGCSINTVTKLLIDAGKACAAFQDGTIRNVNATHVQCDEIWSFCYAKQKNVAPEHEGILGYGDVWTWIALDADSKLAINWLVGLRTGKYAEAFMGDLASRLAGRVQLTTDGHGAYVNAIEKAFGGLVDYAMLVKIFEAANVTEQRRYSPPRFVKIEKRRINGTPDMKDASTSYVERLNLTIRMQNRRFTRLTNAFSKKIENLEHSVALHFMHYNFARIHKSLRVTPAMEAGLTDHVWEIEDIAALIPTPVASKRGEYEKRVCNRQISN